MDDYNKKGMATDGSVGPCNVGVPSRELLAKEVAQELAAFLSMKANEFRRVAESLGELPYPADAAIRITLQNELKRMRGY